MATNELKTRIVLCQKTASEWASDTTTILPGELAIESDTRKVKIGTGSSAFKNLPYMNLTPEEVNSLITASSHTHSNKSILDATTASFTSSLLEKLNGIQTGATKIVVDAALSSTSENPVQNKAVQAALNAKVPTNRTVNGKALSGNITLSSADVGALASSLKGSANGLAELDSSGKVPAAQLPSYVDDVLEGYYYNSKFYKDSSHTSEITGETGKIYMDLATNKIYRWSGSAYAVVSETLALGETSSTAYRGDRGKTAYDHSQAAHAPSNAERNIIIGIQKNGTALAADANRQINITVPTKTSDLSNDNGFITSSGTAAKAGQLTTSQPIDGVAFNGSAPVTHYADCSTAAGTAAKTVSLAGFSLAAGARITVKFTVTNTAASPTLNVSSTGAKPIVYRGSAIPTGYLAANRVYEFVYDGTNWNLIGDINTDTNTTYVAGTGLSLSGNTFNHKNAITAGTAKGDDNKTLTYGGAFTIPSITYDAQGHITSKGSTTMTMPAVPTTVNYANYLSTKRTFSVTGGAVCAPVEFNGGANVEMNVTSLDAMKLAVAAGSTLVLNGTF